MNLNRLILAVAMAAVLTACGGGSSSSSPSANGGNNNGGGTFGGGTNCTASTASFPKTLCYSGAYYLPSNGTAGLHIGGSAAWVDNGSATAGSLTVSDAFKLEPRTPSSAGTNYDYGTTGNQAYIIGSTASDSNLPVIANFCPPIAGSNSIKGKWVLVSPDVTKLASASQLANKTFNAYIEDCAIPSGGGTATFDATGGMSTTGADVLLTLSASDVNTAMTSYTTITDSYGVHPISIDAYSYMDGSTTKYAVVVHGLNNATSATSGFIGVYFQQ